MPVSLPSMKHWTAYTSPSTPSTTSRLFGNTAKNYNIGQDGNFAPFPPPSSGCDFSMFHALLRARRFSPSFSTRGTLDSMNFVIFVMKSRCAKFAAAERTCKFHLKFDKPSMMNRSLHSGADGSAPPTISPSKFAGSAPVLITTHGAVTLANIYVANAPALPIPRPSAKPPPKTTSAQTANTMDFPSFFNNTELQIDDVVPSSDETFGIVLIVPNIAPKSTEPSTTYG